MISSIRKIVGRQDGYLPLLSSPENCGELIDPNDAELCKLEGFVAKELKPLNLTKKDVAYLKSLPEFQVIMYERTKEGFDNIAKTVEKNNKLSLLTKKAIIISAAVAYQLVQSGEISPKPHRQSGKEKDTGSYASVSGSAYSHSNTLRNSAEISSSSSSEGRRPLVLKRASLVNSHHSPPVQPSDEQLKQSVSARAAFEMAPQAAVASPSFIEAAPISSCLDVEGVALEPILQLPTASFLDSSEIAFPKTVAARRSFDQKWDSALRSSLNERDANHKAPHDDLKLTSTIEPLLSLPHRKDYNIPSDSYLGKCIIDLTSEEIPTGLKEFLSNPLVMEEEAKRIPVSHMLMTAGAFVSFFIAFLSARWDLCTDSSDTRKKDLLNMIGAVISYSSVLAGFSEFYGEMVKLNWPLLPADVVEKRGLFLKVCLLLLGVISMALAWNYGC